MYLTADIQARDPERARLAAAFEEFVAAGKTVHRLPGPGEPRAAGVNHHGAPVFLPLREQNQHIHRQPRGRQKAIDMVSWENRQALIERYRERILEAHAQGMSEATISTAQRLTRAQVRMIASAIGVTLRQRAKRKKAEPTIAQLADQVEARPPLDQKDTARELARIRKETAAAMQALERLENRSRRKA
jgi:hypothetical protein